MAIDRMTGKVVWLETVTSLHAGSGAALGAIDLPIQRERHTNWPLVPASSLKGVFRDAARQQKLPSEKRLYGSEDRTALFAGALSFTDARILVFPVRSVHGTFALVSCPMALERWRRDTQLVGEKVDLPPVQAKEGEILVHSGSVLLNGGKAQLEEFELAGKPVDLAGLAGKIGVNAKRLAIVSDEQFGWFVEYATETIARIGLEPGKKTVKKGALFYQEFVPAEALFYFLLLAQDSQTEGAKVSAADNLKEFDPPKYLQFGGDETIGKGLCHVR